MSAAVWEIVRTQAGPMKGAPKSPETRLMLQERTRSQWKPLPLTMFFSGLLRIRLLRGRHTIHYNTVYINLITIYRFGFSTWTKPKGDILADVLLKEDKEEQKQRCRSCQEHAPHGELFGLAEGVDEPATDLRVGRLDAWGHGQLVGVGVLDQVVGQHHAHDGDGDTKITKGTSHLLGEKETCWRLFRYQ